MQTVIYYSQQIHGAARIDVARAKPALYVFLMASSGESAMKVGFLALFAAAVFAQGAAAESVLPPGRTGVDGFRVKLLPAPTKARLAHPASVTGPVYVEKGSGAGCTDPFRGEAGLAGHSKYVCIEGASTATFAAAEPAIGFKLLWGSPDSDNTLSVYDANGSLIGAISGATLDRKLKISNSHDYVLDFKSQTPVGSITLSSTTCCFEMDNFKFKPAP
jgi:hypothetical protein